MKKHANIEIPSKKDDTRKSLQSVEYHGYTVYENGQVMGPYGNVVKQRLHNGRYEIRLNIDKKRKNFIVSRLVYHVFSPFDIRDRDICIVHKDNDKQNIHFNNLKKVKRKNLIQGEKHKNRSRLTDKQVAEIRSLYKGPAGKNQLDKTGYSLNDLAKKYGVSKSNIAMIIKGRSRNEGEYVLK